MKQSKHKLMGPLFPTAGLAVGAFFGGVPGAIAGGMSAQALQYYINGSIIGNPNQASLVDERIKYAITTTRNAVLAIIAGIAGGTVGVAVGAGAGVIAGKNLKEKALFGSIGGVIAGVGSNIAAVAGTFALLQQGTKAGAYNGAKHILVPKKINGMGTLLKEFRGKEGCPNNEAEEKQMIENLESLLAFIRDTTNDQEKREQAFKTLSRFIPHRFFGSDDPEIPSSIHDFLYLSSVGRNTLANDKEFSSRVNVLSLHGVIQNAFALSKAVNLPHVIDQEEMKNDYLDANQWTRYPTIRNKVLETESVKTLVYEHLARFDQSLRNIIRTSLVPENFYDQNIQKIIAQIAGNNRIEHISIETLFTLFPQKIAEILQNESSVSSLFTGDVYKSSLEEFIQNDPQRFYAHYIEPHHNSHLQDSIKGAFDRERDLPPKVDIVKKVVGTDVWSLWNSIPSTERNSIGVTNEHTARQNAQAVIENFLGHPSQTTGNIANILLTHYKSNSISAFKEEAVSVVETHIPIAHTLNTRFRTKSLKKMITEHPSEVLSLLNDANIEAIQSNCPEPTATQVQNANTNGKQLYDALSEPQKIGFWNAIGNASYEQVIEMIEEQGLAKAFNKFPQNIQISIASIITTNPETTENCIEKIVQEEHGGKFFTRNIAPPAGSTEGLSKKLDADYKSEGEDDQSEGNSGSIINRARDIAMNSPLIAGLGANDIISGVRNAVGSLRQNRRQGPQTTPA